VKRLSQFDFHQTLAATPGTSLVMFGSQDCGSCRHLKRAFTALASRREPALTLFEVDVQQDMALASEFEVFHLPAMFLFRDGEFHCELHSPAGVETLLHSIVQALDASAEEAP
jgi:thioredoxin-like negative regulator of GroEL